MPRFNNTKRKLANLGLQPDIADVILEFIRSEIEEGISSALADFRPLASSTAAPASEQVAIASSPRPPLIPQDYGATLTAKKFGAAIGLGEDMVRIKEKKFEIFSIIAPGRKRGRRYPAFQAWTDFTKDSQFAALIRTKFAGQGSEAYMFFMVTNPDLAHLSPIEAWVGDLKVQRHISDDAAEFLRLDRTERIQSVINAAGAVSSFV